MPHLDVDDIALKPFIKNISGTDYLTVAGRVVAAHTVGQLIGVDTDCSVGDDFYRCKATVRILNSHIPNWRELPPELQIATFVGYAQTAVPTEEDRKDSRKSRKPEVTSPLEVTETSALGRALGNAGFGVLESIASFEEVQRAVDSGTAKPPTAKQKSELMSIAQSKGIASTPTELGAYLLKEKELVLADLSGSEVASLIAEIKKMEAVGANKVAF